MSQLPPKHQYVGFCGVRAQTRYLLQRTKHIELDPSQRARLARWLAQEPNAPARRQEVKRLVILHFIVDVMETTGVSMRVAADNVLHRLEQERHALPSVDRYGFLTKQLEGLGI